MGEISEIGYKRTKKGEKIRSNELYREDEFNKILVDDGIEKTMLEKKCK